MDAGALKMKRKLIHSTAARRRTLMKVRHKRILNRQKLFFNFIQPEA
jgi:DNA-directed RNA polymerase specialized sigma54-like protein